MKRLICILSGALIIIIFILQLNIYNTKDGVVTSVSLRSTSPILANSSYKHIFSDFTLAQYFDYTGDLPEDIITPIDYKYNAKINKNLPEFKFEVFGQKIQSYNTAIDKKKYYLEEGHSRIQCIVVKCNELLYSQKLNFSTTNTPALSTDTYGSILDDWNFDGYLDVSLWKCEGGTSLNSPHYYWLWDNAKHQYLECKELEKISEGTSLDLDINKKHIVSFFRYPDGFNKTYYQWKDENINLIKSDDVTWSDIDYDTGKAKAHHIIKEKRNGKLQITDNYYED